MPNETIETTFAWLERISEHVIVQRWKPDITLDVATIKATMELRGQHFGNAPHAVMVIVPTGTNFAMSFLENDQYRNTQATANLFAMANFVEEADVRAIVALYYAQHPPAYVFGVFDHLEEATIWLDEQVAHYLRSHPGSSSMS